MKKVVDLFKLKRIILKNYRNVTVLIKIRGIISTNIRLFNVRVIINKQKLIFADDDNEFILEFLLIKRITFIDIAHIEIEFEDFRVILEI